MNKTHNKGKSSKTSNEQILRRSVTSCLLWEDTFYEDGEAIADRIQKYAKKCDPEFVSLLAVEVRKEHGIRHASLWLAMSLFGVDNRLAKETLLEVISRADEIPEAVAMYWINGKKPLPAQMKKALAEAFHKFDAYQISKYFRPNDDITLRDVMFLCHPKPKSKKQKKLFDDLTNKTLTPPDTWEVALSSGKDKAETFTRLMQEKKLGYLALLRNLRNMVSSGVETKLIVESIKNGNKRGVLPHQFYNAYSEVDQKAIQNALEQAMVDALNSQEKLAGKTILLVDCSGSMHFKQRSNIKNAATTAALIKSVCEESVIVPFGYETGSELPQSGMDLIKKIVETNLGGTDVSQSIKTVQSRYKNDYDRIIVITDEQSSSRNRIPKNDPNVKGYFINVASYKNGVSYEETWNHIDGFSHKVVDYIREFEK